MSEYDIFLGKGDIADFEYDPPFLKAIFTNRSSVKMIYKPSQFWEIAYELGKRNVHITEDAKIALNRLVRKETQLTN